MSVTDGQTDMASEAETDMVLAHRMVEAAVWMKRQYQDAGLCVARVLAQAKGIDSDALEREVRAAVSFPGEKKEAPLDEGGFFTNSRSLHPVCICPQRHTGTEQGRSAMTAMTMTAGGDLLAVRVLEGPFAGTAAARAVHGQQDISDAEFFRVLREQWGLTADAAEVVRVAAAGRDLRPEYVGLLGTSTPVAGRSTWIVVSVTGLDDVADSGPAVAAAQQWLVQTLLTRGWQVRVASESERADLDGWMR